jgi:hypothetical protein
MACRAPTNAGSRSSFNTRYGLYIKSRESGQVFIANFILEGTEALEAKIVVPVGLHGTTLGAESRRPLTTFDADAF